MARIWHYFNEFDPYAAAWLRELMREGLIPAGEVDERSIKDVSPTDLRGFGSCHFFAGIGGWPHALRLAGWPVDRPVWTGSCPCQPYSQAGKRKGQADERDLWPVIFGEQVASADVVGTELEAAFVAAVQRGDNRKANKLAERLAKKHASEPLEELPRVWVDRVRANLAGEGYTFRLCVLGAHSAGADHIRQRVFWVADRNMQRCGAGWGCEPSKRGADESQRLLSAGTVPDSQRTGVRGEQCGGARSETDEMPGEARQQRIRPDTGTGCGGEICELGDTDGSGSQPGRQAAPGNGHGGSALANGAAGVAQGNTSGAGLPRTECEELRGPRGQDEGRAAPEPTGAFWAGAVPVLCRDGKARRVPVEPGLFPLAHGVSGRVAVVRPGIEPEAAIQEGDIRWVNRTGTLRGAGNAIVPQVAAEFVRAFLLTEAEVTS